MSSSFLKPSASSATTSTASGIVVFSGGTAANSLVDVFNELAEKRQCSLSYIIPISDNGGSSSELIRVFGGPGIGDIRSRLVRLIPPSHHYIYALLNHRLPSDPVLALADWQTIVAGTSTLWTPIPSAARELLRSMLNHVHLEILKRARPPHSTFNFSYASVGNLFLTGARLFTGSFESAIYLLALVCGISDHATVIPAIDSNFSHHISAGLANGDVITGQNAISHPSGPSALPGRSAHDDRSDAEPGPPSEEDDDGLDDEPRAEDANIPGTLASLRASSIHFTKPSAIAVAAGNVSLSSMSASASPTAAAHRHSASQPAGGHALPAPIARIWYINPFGHEIRPRANPKAVAAVRRAAAVVFSVGSLYTSIVPSVVLRGIGAALAADADGRTRRAKVLVLNGSADRETGGMGAAGYVAAIARAGEESRGWRADKGRPEDAGGGVDPAAWKQYVTHVVYMEGTGVPAVEKSTLAAAGIECVRCWGRRGEDGVWRYDAKGLVGALDAALGKGRDGELSRRNTLKG